MLLSKLVSLMDIRLDRVVGDAEISGVTTDSTRIKEGYLYIAIEGVHTDGHRFIAEALESGAAAVIVSRGAHLRGISCGECYAVAENTRVAASHACSAFYRHPSRSMRVVAITGTNGKTSTGRILYEILSRSGERCGLIGTAEILSGGKRLEKGAITGISTMTTPEPEELYALLELMRRDGVGTAIMEVTSHAIEQARVDPISFEVGIFTNLTEDHLDLHGTMDAYFRTKARLFSKCKRSIVNADDPYGRALCSELKGSGGSCISCSAEGRAADFCASDVQVARGGIEYKLVSQRLRLRIRSPLCGAFNVMNTLEACAAAHFLGASASDIKQAVGSFCGIPGRFERIKLDMRVPFSVYVDYAHTPDAIENLIRAARSCALRESRIVLLFGCGGDREKEKRPIMGRTASALADHVIITSDNPRGERPADIISEIVRGIEGDSTYTVIEDRREAIEYAIRNARSGDVILLAGKGHEDYEIVNGEMRPFSEAEIVRECVSRYFL